jgi:hypothetical protein
MLRAALYPSCSCLTATGEAQILDGPNRHRPSYPDQGMPWRLLRMRRHAFANYSGPFGDPIRTLITYIHYMRDRVIINQHRRVTFSLAAGAELLARFHNYPRWSSVPAEKEDSDMGVEPGARVSWSREGCNGEFVLVFVLACSWISRSR